MIFGSIKNVRNLNKRLIFLLYCIILTVPNTIFSQDNTVKFKRYSSEDGLNQNSVVSIYQDDEGFLWFGTYLGLNRFDGYNFKKYDFNFISEERISEMYIRSICQDTSGIFFVGTKRGVSRFFAQTEEFVLFEHDPNDSNSLSNNTIYKLLKDKDGDIWVATWGGGLDKMEKINNGYKDERKANYRFIHHKTSNNAKNISSNKIADMAEAPDGSIWIATRNGLNKFNKETNEFTRYIHDPDDINSISDNNVSSVCIDNNGIVWAGTWGEGLNRLDPKTNKFTRIKNNPKNESSLGHNIIMRVYCDKSGTIWVGTWGGGLCKLIKEGLENGEVEFQFQQFQQNKFDLHSLSGNSIYSIYEDSFGVLWVGTEYAGVNKMERNRTQFQHIYSERKETNNLVNNIVHSLMLDNENKLWVGTQGGLNVYDEKTKEYELYQYDPNDLSSLSHNSVTSFLLSRDGTIWVGTIKGLNKFYPKTKKFKQYHNTFSEVGNLHVLSLYETDDELIWVGTYGLGLLSFNPATEKFKRYIHDSNNPNSISDDIIWKIGEGKNGKLWIGTEKGGLCSFDRHTEKFVAYKNDPENKNSLSDNHINTLYIDHAKNLWVGTVNGLNKLVYSENGEVTFTRFNREDGLTGSAVHGIVEDNQRRLWITSMHGINRFNPENNTLVIYTLKDGLQADEFSIDAIINDTLTGKIYAGGINGFNVFYPDKIGINKVPPRVKIIDLKLFTKPVKVGEEINNRVILTKDISALDFLKLTYKEYVFSFEYAALHYQFPEENQYAYKLEGFDEDWNYVGKERTASYTNLEPGTYQFMVKAANCDGVWCAEPATIEVYIKPPWWNTILFKVVAILALVAIIFGIYRLRVKILKSRQYQLEKEVKLRTEELSGANQLLEQKQEEISKQNKELNEVNSLLNEKQEEISQQNEELKDHRINLEKLVEERTAELKAAKLRAEESDRLKSSFLANMSHEVRTPMNAIIGFSGLLENDSLDKQRKEYFLKTIKNNGETLLALIDDILDISIIDANQLVLYKDRFCLDDLLTELYSYYEIRNDKQLNIELIKSNGTNKIYLNNDKIRLRQVITNLMNNAIKFTETGFVRFGYILEGDTVEIFVEDSGLGIDKESLKHIFDYFYKVDKGAAKAYRGSGIGLSICKRLVEMMGSKIHVESKIGKGSRFYFSMLRVNYKKTGEQKIEKDTKKYSFKDINIIIAEDEPDNYMLLHTILKNTEANIHWARNGKEAVDLVKENLNSDKGIIVLMDIKMPVMNGIEANRILKKMNGNIPVIALTAYAKPDDEARIMKEKFDHYISKPINSKLLIETIAYYLNK